MQISTVGLRICIRGGACIIRALRLLGNEHAHSRPSLRAGLRLAQKGILGELGMRSRRPGPLQLGRNLFTLGRGLKEDG